MVDYDTIVAYEVPPDGSPVEWVSASKYSDRIPAEMMLRTKKYDNFLLLIDVCTRDEFEAGEGDMLSERVGMLEDVAAFVNEIVKEIVVKSARVHIVRDIRTLLKIQESTLLDLKTMKNETAIIGGGDGNSAGKERK